MFITVRDHTVLFGYLNAYHLQLHYKDNKRCSCKSYLWTFHVLYQIQKGVVKRVKIIFLRKMAVTDYEDAFIGLGTIEKNL
jgi:hypothetical protein